MVNAAQVQTSLATAQEAAQLDPGNPKHAKDVKFWTHIGKAAAIDLPTQSEVVAIDDDHPDFDYFE